MSSTSTSSSIASFYTSNGVTRLNGSEFASGLDTQSLITALTAKTQSKIDKQNQLEQKAEWKQSMYRDVEALLQSFSDSYFSYATSSSNIMSSSFFDTGALTSSNSDVVSATGGAQDAGNVVINSISQLATASSLSTGYGVSQENITSGDIRNSWKQSTVGGNSMVLSYGGTDYTITLSNSVTLDDTASAQVDLQKIADGLNSQISATSGLSASGAKFSVKGDATNGYYLSLNSTSSVTLSASKSSDTDSTGVKFLSALGLSASSGTTINGTAVKDPAALFSQTVSSASYLDVNVGGTNYTLTLGADVDFSGVTDLSKIGSGLADQLNKQVSANTSLNGKITFSADSSGKISMTGGTVTGGSQNLINGLGMTESGGAYSFGAINKGLLATSYLGDTLAGSTLTLKLDGVSKTITFNQSEESSYSNVAGIKSYLQTKIDTAFGSGKITVSQDSTDGNKLVFATADSTSILEFASSSVSNVLGDNGALRIEDNETNRTETSKTLKDLSSELNLTLSTGAEDSNGIPLYEFTINGKKFSFNEDTELNTVINTINDDTDADVNISYSQTTNKFRITSDDTGSQGKISIYDDSGNLAQSLFGIDHSNIFEISSGSFTLDENNKYTIGSGTYSFQVGTGAAQNIAISASSYDSMQSLANDVQKDIDSNAQLKGTIKVGVDGTKLTFNSIDNSADSSKVTIKSVSGSDFLGLGTTGKSTAVTDGTLADLFTDGCQSITSNGDGTYSVAGSTKKYSNTTALATALLDFSNIGSTGFTQGKDLQMNATVGGTAQDITRSTNSFTLDGISLTISGAYNTSKDSTVSPIKFTASNNVDDLYKKISDFVDAYNKIIDKANTYTSQTPYGLNSDAGTNTKYDPLTDAQKKEMTTDEITAWNDKAKQGLLQNDNALNTLLSNLQSAMLDTVSSVGLTLNDIGISTASYDYTSGGKLVIDETTLKNKLKSDPEKVSELFTNADGVSARVKDVIVKNIGTYGNSGTLVDLAGSSTQIGVDNSQLATQISEYKKTITDLQTQMQSEQDRWQTKFTNMETAVYKLSSQMNYLNSMSSGS